MESPSASTRAVRVCVTGAECSGKTTLALALGERLGAPVGLETVRDYFARKAAGGDVNVYAADIVRVVDIQVRTEDRMPQDAPVIVLDTDVFTIAVWHERYLGHRFEELDRLVETRQASASCIDLYILCSPDMPFEHDEVRGSRESRDAMHETFRRELELTGRHFIEVSGTVDERCERALAELSRLVAEHAECLSRNGQPAPPVAPSPV